MPPIEFLDDDGTRDGAAEELAPPPRRRFPLWLLALALVVVAAIVAVVVKQTTASTPTALPSPASTTPTPRTSSEAQSIPPLPVTTPVVPVPSLSELGGYIGGLPMPVLDVTSVGGEFVSLAPDSVSVVRDGKVTNTVAFSRPLEGLGFAGPRLVVDPAASRVWVVVIGAGDSGRVIGVDLSRRRVVLDEPAPVAHGAAVLDHRLYLSVGGDVVEITPVGREHVAASLAGALGTLVPDPARHRLIQLSDSFPTTVWVLRRKGTRLATGPSRILALNLASAAVVSGALWVAGYADATPNLIRLDPVTLAPRPPGRKVSTVHSGAQLVAAGHAVIWVRTQTQDGTALLRCLSARTGRASQTWEEDGGVASIDGEALVVSGGRLVTMRLGSCSG